MHFAKNLMLLNIMFLLIMLFGFGGIQVWMGTIGKGLFRATLGPFGGVAFLMTKFAIPALFAYLTVLMLGAEKNSKHTWMWRVNAVLIFLAGSTWGFKTTGLFMMLPALLILYWNLTASRLLGLVFAFGASLVLFFYWFDAELLEEVDVLTFLLTRLTVLQGDVPWHIWGLYSDGEALPNYWPTLLAAIGDTLLSTFFVSKSNLYEWMSFHYDWMITYLSGTPIEYIADGHSVTATPFAEGLIAGGWAGVMLFSVIGGLLIGRTYYYLDRAIKTYRCTTAAILSTYFCFHIFSWLNGGAITQLFHISILVYLLFTYGLIKMMSLKLPERINDEGRVNRSVVLP
jgi:hypothetical protein